MSELPPGWATAAIRELCTLENGRAFKPSDWTEHGVPIVRIQNLNREGASFNHFAGEVSDRYRLRGGELLFAWSGTPGTSFGAHVWRGGEAVLNQHIFRVDFDESVVEKRFFRHAINQKLEELIDVAHGGVGLRHVTKGVFENTEVLVPPLPEQKRIADKLDALLARVDACRGRLDRVPGILKRFRQSLLAAATSGELTREWREERGIDEAWDELPLEEIIEGKPRNGYSPRAVEHATPVKSLTLTATTTGRFRGEHFKYIDEQIPADSHLWLRPGDVLIQRANTLEYVGVSAIFDGPENTFIYPDLMMKCRANKRVLPAFLHLVLSSQPVRKYFRENATGTAGNMPKINQQTVLSAPAVVPSIEEQKQIVARTTELLGMADALERAHTAALAKVTKLTPSALTKAFRGELVAQDPNDEPAPALLAKLKTAETNAAAEPSRRRPKTPGKRPTMSNTDKDSIKAAILKLKTDRFSFDELRAQVSGDHESLKVALFELLEEPSPVVRQVFDKKAKAMQLVRVRP